MEGNAIYIGIIIALVLIIVICALIIIYRTYFKDYIQAHYKLATYADIPLSMKNNSIYINCINVDRYPELWNAHESDLDIYAMGLLIPSVFFKSADVPTGYKIAYSSTLTNQQVLSLLAAVKYHKFEISHDGGETRFPVISISDKEAKKITHKLNYIHSNLDGKQRDEVLNKIKNSAKYDFIGNEINNDRIISHVDENKTTAITIRYQAIIPNQHEVYNKGFTPEGTKFYYTYYGKLYEFKVKYLGNVENLYEWELYGLNPSSIYTGFSHSVDGGKTILPSTSLYAITKDDDGRLPDVSNAILGKPSEGDEGFEMWTGQDGVEYMGQDLVKKTCDIMIKKHYEDEFVDEFAAISRIDDYYGFYDKWIPFTVHDMKIDNNSKK